MRGSRFVLAVAVLALIITPLTTAQSILDDQFQILDPMLTASVIEDSIGVCSASMPGPGCHDTSFTADVDYRSFSILGGATDALGRFYQIARVGVPVVYPDCFSYGSPPQQLAMAYEIQRTGPAGVEVLARVLNCVQVTAPPNSIFQETNLVSITLDNVNGDLLVGVWSATVNHHRGIVKISGLPRLLDIILSYQPSTSSLSWNAPVMPEALPSADSYSLYTGDLRTVSDLSYASALECAVPTGRAPVPGETLTVPDSVPFPSSGQGSYYVVAANYQGQRRAGRYGINGVLHGRNSAALPACQ